MADAVYGDSYSAVQAADLQQQAARRAALVESQRALNASFENLAKINQQQQQLALQHEQLEGQKAEHARTFAMTKQYYDWLMKQETPAQTRQRDFEFKAAAQDADTGLFDDPDHVKSFYPNLTPAEADLFAKRSATIRPQYEQAYGAASNAAGVLNRKLELTDYIAKSTEAAKDATHILGNDTATDASGKKYKIPDYENQRKADWQAELEALNKSGINPNDKRIASLITFNPDSGQWEPTIMRPHWLDRAAPAKNRALPAGVTGGAEDDETGAGAVPPSGAGAGAEPSAQAPVGPNRTATMSTFGNRMLQWAPAWEGAGAGQMPPITGTSRAIPGAAPAERVGVFKDRMGNTYRIPESKWPLALSRGGTLLSVEGDQSQGQPQELRGPMGRSPDAYKSKGGIIRGRGTGTSDSVPIHASRGEYVVPAAVVRMPGVLPALERLRNMGRRLNYADGGLVEGPLVPPSNFQMGGPGENLMGGDGLPFQSGAGRGTGMDWQSIIAQILRGVGQGGGSNMLGLSRILKGSAGGGSGPYSDNASPYSSEMSGYEVFRKTSDPRLAYNHAIQNKLFKGGYDEFVAGQLGIDPITGRKLTDSDYIGGPKGHGNGRFDVPSIDDWRSFWLSQ